MGAPWAIFDLANSTIEGSAVLTQSSISYGTVVFAVRSPSCMIPYLARKQTTQYEITASSGRRLDLGKAARTAAGRVGQDHLGAPDEHAPVLQASREDLELLVLKHQVSAERKMVAVLSHEDPGVDVL